MRIFFKNNGLTKILVLVDEIQGYSGAVHNVLWFHCRRIFLRSVRERLNFPTIPIFWSLKPSSKMCSSVLLYSLISGSSNHTFHGKKRYGRSMEHGFEETSHQTFLGLVRILEHYESFWDRNAFFWKPHWIFHSSLSTTTFPVGVCWSTSELEATRLLWWSYAIRQA